MSRDETEDDTLPELVQAGAPATVTVRSAAHHLCPFIDEVDVGTVEVVFEAAEQTLELHSLRTWLATLATWRVSHEAYTYHVREQLEKVGVRVKGVTTTWETAGMEVIVQA